MNTTLLNSEFLPQFICILSVKGVLHRDFCVNVDNIVPELFKHYGGVKLGPKMPTTF